ncbi:MAG: O-antigen ligase family protein [Gelidibacter sp.]
MLLLKNNIFKTLIQEKDISFLLLGLTLFLLPFSINLSTFTLILSLAFKFVQVFVFDFRVFRTKALKASACIGFVFFAYMILLSILQTGLSHTIDMFGKQFQHWMLLFLVPMLLRERNINTILIKVFFLGLCISICYVFALSYINGNTLDQDSFESIIDIHHTYLSVFLLFIINHVLIKLIKNQNNLSIPQVIVQVAIISGAFWLIYLVDSKVSIILFVVLFIIHVFPELSKENAVKYLLIFLTILAAFYVFNHKLKTSYETALDFRLQIWDASVENIESHPFFGNLHASEKELLNYQHYLNGKYYYLDRDLNSHNQYLSILLKYGVFGFMILSSYCVLLFKNTNPKTGKIVMRETIGFLAIVLLVFYIENVLDRHHGIVFFTVFYNYYLVAVENAEI